MIVAFIAFALATLALIAVEEWLDEHVVPISWPGWLTEHIYMPALRATALVAFLLAGYPAIYATDALPPLGEVLAGQSNWFDDLIWVAWLVAVGLPLLPVIGRMQSVVLPLQANTTAAVLFAWAAQAAGIDDYSLWPGLEVGVLIVVLAGIGAWLARKIGLAVAEHRLDAELGHRVHEAGLLFFQGPAVMVYTTALGSGL